jgi:hypothetical protein
MVFTRDIPVLWDIPINPAWTNKSRYFIFVVEVMGIQCSSINLLYSLHPGVSKGLFIHLEIFSGITFLVHLSA